MESMGIIKKITEPSEWCAGIAIVPKSTGAVRICGDLKLLNTSVLREPHPIPIPMVDETLAQLSGATFLVKSMRTLDFGRSLYQKSRSHMQLLSLHLVNTVFRSCHSASQVLPNFFRGESAVC